MTDWTPYFLDETFVHLFISGNPHENSYKEAYLWSDIVLKGYGNGVTSDLSTFIPALGTPLKGLGEKPPLPDDCEIVYRWEDDRIFDVVHGFVSDHPWDQIIHFYIMTPYPEYEEMMEKANENNN